MVYAFTFPSSDITAILDVPSAKDYVTLIQFNIKLFWLFIYFQFLLANGDYSQAGNVHLDFDEVWSAKSNKVGVVLQIRSVVAFDESEPVNSSLTLHAVATYVSC